MSDDHKDYQRHLDDAPRGAYDKRPYPIHPSDAHPSEYSTAPPQYDTPRGPPPYPHRHEPYPASYPPSGHDMYRPNDAYPPPAAYYPPPPPNPREWRTTPYPPQGYRYPAHPGVTHPRSSPYEGPHVSYPPPASYRDIPTHPKASGETILAPAKFLPPIHVISTPDKLLGACTTLAGCTMVSVEPHVKGSDSAIELLAVAPDDESCIYVIDVVALSLPVVTKLLGPVFSDSDLKTLVFDIEKIAPSLIKKAEMRFGNLVDIQSLGLLWEWETAGVNQVRPLSHFIKKVLQMKPMASNLESMEEELTPEKWGERPLSDSLRDYAAHAVNHYTLLHRKLCSMTKDAETMSGKIKDTRLSMFIASGLRTKQAQVQNLESLGCGPGGVCIKCEAKGHHADECPVPGTTNSQTTYPSADGAYSHSGMPPPHEGYLSMGLPPGPPLPYPSRLPPCPGCGKMNHLPERCFVLHPELLHTRHHGGLSGAPPPPPAYEMGLYGRPPAEGYPERHPRPSDRIDFAERERTRASLVCDYCHKTGHTEDRCFDKQPELRGKVQCSYCQRMGHIRPNCDILYPERAEMRRKRSRVQRAGEGTDHADDDRLRELFDRERREESSSKRQAT